MLGLAPAVEKENVWRSGSFGDSKALGIAGTGGTSSPSTPAELWTLRGFAVGNLELCKVGLVRRGMEEPLGGFKELMLDVEDKVFCECWENPECLRVVLRTYVPCFILSSHSRCFCFPIYSKAAASRGKHVY